MKKRVHRLDSGPAWAVVITVSVLLAIGLAVPVSSAVPDDVCADCHEIATTWGQTSHGLFFVGEAAERGAGCESCHGDAVEHVQDGDPAKILNPANHDQFGGSMMCMTCHDDHQFDDWQFSAHNAANMNCSDCHTIHGTVGQTSKKEQPELCYDCHSDSHAAAHMPSRHPIGEGKLMCGDCHGIHGGSGRLTQEATGRELCFSCHAEKEGPFVFEHAPVMEDCNICHVPHGSVADNLLKQNEPALCLSCHPMHFHTTAYSVDGDFSTPQAPERAGTSSPDSWKSGMLTKCTQCHAEIHGTDLPSQTSTTGGNALTR